MKSAILAVSSVIPLEIQLHVNDHDLSMAPAKKSRSAHTFPSEPNQSPLSPESAFHQNTAIFSENHKKMREISWSTAKERHQEPAFNSHLLVIVAAEDAGINRSVEAVLVWVDIGVQVDSSLLLAGLSVVTISGAGRLRLLLDLGSRAALLGRRLLDATRLNHCRRLVQGRNAREECGVLTQLAGLRFGLARRGGRALGSGSGHRAALLLGLSLKSVGHALRNAESAFDGVVRGALTKVERDLFVVNLRGSLQRSATVSFIKVKGRQRHKLTLLSLAATRAANRRW